MAGSPLDIRFTRGIDAQNDPRLVEQPFLLKADNVYFDAEKGPRKRSGYSVYSQQVSTNDGSTQPAVSSTAVVTHKDELLCFDNKNLYANSDYTTGWVNRGSFTPTSASIRPASPTSETQLYCEVANYGSQYELTVFYTASMTGNINFSIRDKTSGGYLRYNETLVANPGGGYFQAQPKLVRTVNGMLLIYMTSAGLNARPLGPSAMSSPFAGAPVLLAPRPGSLIAQFFDVAFDGTNTIVVANTNDTVFTFFSLSSLGAPRTVKTASYPASSVVTALSITPFDPGPSGNVDGSVYFTYAYKPQSGGSYFPSTDQATVSQYLYKALTVGQQGPTYTQNLSATVAVVQMGSVHNYLSGLSTVFTYRKASGTSSPYTDTGQYSTQWYNGVGAIQSSASGILPMSAVMASKPFVYNGQPFAFFGQQGPRVGSWTYTTGLSGTTATLLTQQGSAVLINLANGAPVAQIGYGVTAIPDQGSNFATSNGVNVLTGYPPPNPVADGTGLFEIAVPKTVKLIASATNATGFDSINYYYMYGVRFVGANQIQSVQFGDTRVFSGGLTSFYDTVSVVEHGFLSAPEIVAVPSMAGAGGVTTVTGAYLACAVYEWTDRQGNLHRSAPGPAVTFNLNSAASTNAPVATVAPPFTSKTNVQVAYYMTKLGGTLFYRIGAVAMGANSPPLVPPVGAVASETLYTTGNILPNDPWPNSNAMAASRNRVFMAAGEDPDLLYFSKAYVRGEGQGLSLAFTKRVAAVPGAITAIAAMDDKVVVFKARSILYFYGQNGPNTDGSNDDFSAPQLLTTEVGCVSKGSVLATSEGVYFQGEKGIWLLSRSMNLTFVGQPIGPLTLGKTITSAVLTAKNTTVRFGTLDGSAFIYHYRMPAQFGDSLQCGQWTTYSNYKQYSATLHRGIYCFARADGRVCLEQDGTFKDDAQPVKFTLSTAWLRVGALLQTGQFTDVALLGSYAGPHTLLLRVHRDYSTGVDSVLKYATPTAISTSTWGSDPTWGGRTPFGGDFDDTYVARWRLPRGCTSMGLVRFSISDEGAAGYDLGATCQILGLNLLGQGQSDLAHPGDKKRQ